MSLINRMLQDLEQRSASDPFASDMQQLRAAPERGGVHLAWWLVLLLSVVLAGVCVWFWLRPAPVPPVAMPHPAEAQVAPAIAVPPAVLQPVIQPVKQMPLPVAQAPLPAAPIPVTAARKVASSAQGVASTPDAQHVAAQPAPSDSPAPPRVKPAPVAASRKAATAVSKNADALAGSPDGSDATKPAGLTKEIKELTPSQQAENAYRSAVSALQQGQQADAITDLEQALQLDARHAAARQMLVGVLLQAKRADDAVHRAQEGVALDPTQTGLVMILAHIQVEQGDLHAALDTLQHNLSYALDNADYQELFAVLLERDKRHKEAIEHYIAALRKAPQNGVWWMGLGISLQADNRLPEAKEAFHRAKITNTLTPALQAVVDQKLAQLH